MRVSVTPGKKRPALCLKYPAERDAGREASLRYVRVRQQSFWPSSASACLSMKWKGCPYSRKHDRNIIQPLGPAIRVDLTMVVVKYTRRTELEEYYLDCHVLGQYITSYLHTLTIIFYKTWGHRTL
jgi:hypothetical protein